MNTLESSGYMLPDILTQSYVLITQKQPETKHKPVGRAMFQTICEETGSRLDLADRPQFAHLCRGETLLVSCNSILNSPAELEENVAESTELGMGRRGLLSVLF